MQAPTNVFEGINRGLQSFIQTQMTLKQMQRQEEQDAKNMQMFEKQLALTDYQLKKVEREARGEEASESASKEIPEFKTEAISLGNVPQTHEADVEVSDRMLTEERKTPLSLADRSEYMAKKLEEKGFPNLALQHREKAADLSLKEIQRKNFEQKHLIETVNLGHTIGRHDVKQGQAFIGKALRDKGMSIEDKDIDFGQGGISVHSVTLPNGTKKSFYSTLKGDIIPIPEDTNIVSLEVFIKKNTDSSGKVNYDKVIKEYEEYEKRLIYAKKTETSGARDAGDADERFEIRQEIASRKDSIKSKIKGLDDSILNNIVDAEGGFISKLVGNDTVMYRMVGTEKVKLSSKERASVIDGLQKRDKLTDELGKVSREVFKDYGRDVPKRDTTASSSDSPKLNATKGTKETITIDGQTFDVKVGTSYNDPKAKITRMYLGGGKWHPPLKSSSQEKK